MPRYFMHLIDSTNILLDPEGMEMLAEAIPAKALLAARDCMAGDVKDGRLDLHYRIEVRDEGDRWSTALSSLTHWRLLAPGNQLSS